MQDQNDQVTVRFSKTYCGSWEPYQIDAGPHGLHIKNIPSKRELMEFYGIKSAKKVGTGWAITSRDKKRIYPIWEGVATRTLRNKARAR